MILQIFNVLLHPIFLLTADYKGPDCQIMHLMVYVSIEIPH